MKCAEKLGDVLKKLLEEYSDEKSTKLYKDDSGHESGNNEEAQYSSKYSVAQVFTIGADTIEEPVLDTPQEVASATSSVTPTLVSSDILTTSASPEGHTINFNSRPCIEKKENGENKKGNFRIYTDTPEKNPLEQLEYERGLRKKIKGEKNTESD
ncbi:hypothetical protein JTB14_038031 [Gonioctena quinquepunctata]|nr:hypothetical protein JTB14_038031 [Gonioctena quinquepunctata]